MKTRHVKINLSENWKESNQHKKFWPIKFDLENYTWQKYHLHIGVTFANLVEAVTRKFWYTKNTINKLKSLTENLHGKESWEYQ